MEGGDDGEHYLYCRHAHYVFFSHSVTNRLNRSLPSRNQVPDYPFQSTPVSLNKTWLCVIACLAFFALGYYQIGKIEKRKARIKVLAAENEKLKSSIANGTAAVSSQSSAKPIPDANSGGESQMHNAGAAAATQVERFLTVLIHSIYILQVDNIQIS